MTDETTRLPDEDNPNLNPVQPTALEPDADWNMLSTGGSALDIDAALAAAAALSDEPATPAEAQDIALDAAPRKRVGTYAPALSLPPMTRLKRGQLGSLVPALVLIGVGAWLTLTTTSGASLDPLLLIAALIGGIAVSLLAHWLGSGRWSRGTLLFGVLIALTAAGIGAAALRGELGRTYPLILAFAGVALILAGVLSRPPMRRAFAPGLLLIAAGVVGALVTLGIVPSGLLPFAASAAPIVAILVVIVLLLPRLRRR